MQKVNVPSIANSKKNKTSFFFLWQQHPSLFQLGFFERGRDVYKCCTQLQEEERIYRHGFTISKDLNRETILTDTNDVTLTLKNDMHRIFLLYFFWLSNFKQSFLFCSRFLLLFLLMSPLVIGVLYKLESLETCFGSSPSTA